jgi:hypothetical protein
VIRASILAGLMLALSCGTSAQAQRPNGNNAQKKPPQRQADEKIDFERARGLLQKPKPGEKHYAA